jgi:hypothetical protein
VPGAPGGDGAGRPVPDRRAIDGALLRHPPAVVLPDRGDAELAGGPVPLLILRADPDDRDALLSIGRPFFAPRAGPGRIGVLLSGDVDWDEIGELVTDSYRAVAPKKLAALLDERARPCQTARRWVARGYGHPDCNRRHRCCAPLGGAAARPVAALTGRRRYR